MSDNFRISIHALLAESDLIALFDFPIVPVISIHALLAESDRVSESRLCRYSDFYPRSPCGERRRAQAAHYRNGQISIHALLAESDRRALPGLPCIPHFYPRSPCGERLKRSRRATSRRLFLSTLSLRRATGLSYFYIIKITISIHALLAESDLLNRRSGAVQNTFLSTLSLRRATCNFSQKRHPPHNFYPRSPCGERRIDKIPYQRQIDQFLSTLSLRRATIHFDNYNLHCVISIHALLAESDLQNWQKPHKQKIFLSTLSLRRATFDTLSALAPEEFLSTLSLRRATLLMCFWLCGLLFLSTLSLRRATIIHPR